MSAFDKLHIEKLDRSHVLRDFDCGYTSLNRFLQSFALGNQYADSSATYVAVADATVAGYHTITFGSIKYDDAPERLARGLPRYPISAMIIGRLAVDRRFQGRGLGSALLGDAMRRGLAASEIAGMRGIIVHAKDQRAAEFYRGFGFMPFVDRPLTLYRLLKDIRARPR